MNNSISAWAPSAESKSPTGLHIAKIEVAMEVAMGAPTDGPLEVFIYKNRSEPIIKVDSCNPSFVWSEDGKFLAVPQWDMRDRTQRLIIIDVEKRHTNPIPGQFHVLQLESFENSIVKGVDSPIYMPKSVEIDVTKCIQK